MSPFLDDEVQWRPIAPAARRVWGGAGTLAIGAVCGPAALAAALGGVAPVAIGVALAGLAAIALWWGFSLRRWRAWGYAERDADLLIRHGVLIRRLTIVPYGRMQFVDLRQGPLGRALHVATLKLHTAAAASDAGIPMLAEDEASRLRDRLAALGEARAAGL